jgi:2-polyprenyl-3-methyl-5-hydroxy-6-metoxy-1,4-benzoquinol methylase
MFGLNEEFEYFQCSNCNCLQIKDFPVNLKKYYPPDYLNYPKVKRSPLREYLMNSREKAFLSGKGLFGKLLMIFFGFSDSNLLWASQADIKINASILEVGCGKGELLQKLHRAGFHSLLGVDAFIEEDIYYDENFRIIKRDFNQFDGIKFDWIMFHHSFEHLKDPVKTFKKLNTLLNTNGKILIRIPIIDCFAWEYYKTDWIQLDPPRHFFIHSIKSIEYLAHNNNFKINKIVYDSTAFQFLGSEHCKRKIPLMDPKSYFMDSNHSLFTEQEVERFDRKAKELNETRRGDAACFILQKII